VKVIFINQLMHSIITIAHVKIYVIQKSKRRTLKIRRLYNIDFNVSSRYNSVH